MSYATHTSLWKNQMQCTVFGGAIELVLQKYHHIPVGTCAMIGQLSGTYFPVQPTKFKRVFELEFPLMYLNPEIKQKSY